MSFYVACGVLLTFVKIRLTTDEYFRWLVVAVSGKRNSPRVASYANPFVSVLGNLSLRVVHGETDGALQAGSMNRKNSRNFMSLVQAAKHQFTVV